MNTKNIFKLNFMSKAFCFIMLFLISFVNLNAQQNEIEGQNITIYTDYTLVLQEADRIQFLPEINDTITVNPDFSYSVSPIVYNTFFVPTQINAAKLSEEPLPTLDNGLIKLGLGNYLSPFIEVFYNSDYSKDYSYGAYAKHYSAHSKVKNSLSEKIYTGFQEYDFKVFGKKMFQNSTLLGDVSFDSHEVYYYGYDPELKIADSLNVKLPRDKAEMQKQRWMNFGTDIQLKSRELRPNSFHYDMIFKYDYMFNLTDDNHHAVRVFGDFEKETDNFSYGIDAGFIYHNDFVANVKNEHSYLNLNPYIAKSNEQWKLKLGLNTTGEFEEDSSTYHFYPNILIQHNISNTIIPYVSFSGYLEDNCINSLRITNPFIQRIDDVEVTNYAQVLNIGFKGNVSRNFYFHLNGNYSKIDNMLFFVNDTTEVLNNKFIVENTNVERFAGYGEVSLRNIASFNFTLKANYYHYSYIQNKNNFGEKPWHMPVFDLTFNTEYNFSEELKFGADIKFIGKRFAKEYNSDLSIIEKELSPIVDFNLYGEYRFASNFSSFLYLNNILGQKQYVWNNYHSLGFNVLAGIKYSF